MRDREHANRPKSGVNRRDFLKGSGAAVAATAVVSAAAEAVNAEPQQKTNRVVSAKAGKVVLYVNGEEKTLTLEPRVTLLDALRNDLNLTGCKDVCDRSNCGACTVLVDGKATLACTRLAIELRGKKITTVESLAQGKKLDPVISAFVKYDATQCGFCTPGFVVAVRAFLNKNPDANKDEINKGLGGNLCRCGTYNGVLQAALDVAKKGGA